MSRFGQLIAVAAIGLAGPAASAFQADGGYSIEIVERDGTVTPFALPFDKNESLASFANGCQFVRAPGGFDQGSDMIWEGECLEGLAHGSGQIASKSYPATPKTPYHFHYGRQTLAHETEATVFTIENGQTIRVKAGGTSAAFLIPDRNIALTLFRVEPDLELTAVDGVVQNNISLRKYARTANGAFQPLSDWRLQVYGDPCYSVPIGKSPTFAYSATIAPIIGSNRSLAQQVQRACATAARKKVAAKIFFVERLEYREGNYTAPAVSEKRLCPTLTDITSCTAIWRELLTPMRPELLDHIATARERHVAQRARLDARYPQILANLKQWRSERSIALAAQREAERQAREEAEARKRAEFEQRLARGNAGQLFTLADELKQNGDSAGARAALRALIERFPDSPLAANAASQLSGVPSSPSPVASPASHTPAAPASRPARSCRSHLDEMIETVNAGSNQLNYAQQVELAVHIRHLFQRMASQMTVCQQDAAFVAHMRTRLSEVQQECRSAGGTRCDSGTDMRAPAFRQAMDAMAQRVIANANAGGGGSPATAAASAACGRTPDQELAAFDAEVERLRKACPQRANWGSRAELQWTYHLMSAALQQLEPRRVCLGQHYEGTRVGITNARDAAKRGCDQLSSGPLCTATCPP